MNCLSGYFLKKQKTLSQGRKKPWQPLDAIFSTGFFATVSRFYGARLTRLHINTGEKAKIQWRASSGDGAPKLQISVPCRGRTCPACPDSLKIFNLTRKIQSCWKFQSLPSEFHTKIGVWWTARLKFSIELENISIPEGDLDFFQSLGPSGCGRKRYIINSETSSTCNQTCKLYILWVPQTFMYVSLPWAGARSCVGGMIHMWAMKEFQLIFYM